MFLDLITLGNSFKAVPNKSDLFESKHRTREKMKLEVVSNVFIANTSIYSI